MWLIVLVCFFFFFQAEDGIRDFCLSRGLGDVYKRQYIFNTLGFYLGGVLVAFMAAGFCMLECGLVTTKLSLIHI